MAKKLSFAIIGAGNGGQTMAADLIMRGFRDTSIYDVNPDPIRAIVERGGIELVGSVLQGFSPVELATTELDQGLDGKDIIMVVTTATAHEQVAKSLVPLLRDGQIVVIVPGYYGSLVFRRVFREAGMQARVTLAETLSLPYATRLVGPACVGLRAIKRSLLISALPASRTQEVLGALTGAFPMLMGARNVLEVSLNNPNPVHHVAVTLFNLGRVESADLARGFYDWSSPSIDYVSGLVDEERLEVVSALGLRAISVQEFDQTAYGGQPKKVVEPLGEIGPSSYEIPPRYIEEDTPMGLVPISEFGRLTSTRTPTVDLLIDVAGLVKKRNYRAQGLTPEKLGLAEMSREQIVSMVERES